MCGLYSTTYCYGDGKAVGAAIECERAYERNDCIENYLAVTVNILLPMQNLIRDDLKTETDNGS